MTRDRKPKRSLILCAMLMSGGLLLSACNFLPQEEEELAPPLMEPASIEYRTQPVERGTIVVQTRLSGSFEPQIQEALSFEQQSGRLAHRHVRLGQFVEEDEILLELDSEQVERQIELQEIEVEKAEISLQQVRASGADRYAVRRAELDLKQQEMRLEDLQNQLEATRIRAPFDGEITYLPSLSTGDHVNAYQIVVRIADLSDLILVTTSDQASDLPLGVKVEVEVGDQTLEGEVIANPSTLYTDPDERLHRAAIIDVDDSEFSEDIGLGDSARITYIEDMREDVLVLPRSRINMMSGRRYVNVLEDDVRVEKDVEVGLMTETEVEIISGLEEGDLVIAN